MAEAPLLTEKEKRAALALAGDIARFVVHMNASNPIPPDVHHRALGEACERLLALLQPEHIIRPKR